MSAGVLAVLDGVRIEFEDAIGAEWAAMREARAAIVELIEANKRLCKKRPVTADQYGITAALARAQGGAK